jgi:hypothetical protein
MPPPYEQVITPEYGTRPEPIGRQAQVVPLRSAAPWSGYQPPPPDPEITGLREGLRTPRGYWWEERER